LVEHGVCLLTSEDDGELGRAFDPLDFIDEGEFALEDLLVKEEEAAQGLVLGGGGDVFVHCEVGKELSDFVFAHLVGMAFVVEEDVAPDPIDIGLLGAD
jgi:hypothetical protein